MWLAEGIEVPGYSAIFFRRTYAGGGALRGRRVNAKWR